MRAAVPPIAFEPHDLGPQSPETSSDVVDSLTPALMRVNLDKKRGADDLRVSFDRSSDEDGPRSNTSRDSSKRSSLGQTPVGIKQLKNSPTGASSTVVLYSKAGLGHDTGAKHQESVMRLAVLGVVSDGLRELQVEARESSFKCPLGDVVRVHDADYVRSLQDKCSKLPATSDVTPAQGACLDTDTRLCANSLDAALGGCGAACEAIDLVATNRAQNVFVACRPPGHHVRRPRPLLASRRWRRALASRPAHAIEQVSHRWRGGGRRAPRHRRDASRAQAGPRGAVACFKHFWRSPDMCSCGFCLLNTAAVAGAYARYRYGRPRAVPEQSKVLRKVAIIDFDVHHGNGTEEIVKGLKPHKVQKPLPDSWPAEYREVHKPWLDESDGDEVFFGSVHLWDAKGAFYPGGGGPQESSATIVNVPLSAVGPKPGDVRARQSLTASQRAKLCDEAGANLRRDVSAQLLPALQRFDADLVIFSAGFDGYEADLYHWFRESDYEWLTHAVLDASPRASCISILEGGYSTWDWPPKEAKRAGTRRTASPDQDTEVQRPGLLRACAAHVSALAARAPPSPPPRGF
jgi:acetoin utilization deacetylase AcuC-like enzyme